MKIKAVLFDLFDTLLLVRDDGAFYERALAKIYSFLMNSGLNFSFEEFRRTYFEVRDKMYMETEANLEEPHFKVRFSATLKRLGYECDAFHPLVDAAARIFAEEFAQLVMPDSEAAEVLQTLYGKYKLAVVSNLSIHEAAYELLEKFDLRKYFDVVVISSEVNRRKPSPEIFKKAIDALNVKACEAVFIGDTLSMDIKGAKNVQMLAFLIQRPNQNVKFIPIFQNYAEKTQTQPDKVIQSLKELPTLLKEYQ